MREIMLTKLAPGDTKRITRITGGRGFQQKMAMMGVKEGSIVTVKKSAASGGPVVIEVERNSIALGRGMSQKIYVESN